MKTIPELKQELLEVKHRIQNEELKRGEENKLRKRLPFLKTCIMYLEEKPNPAYMKDEIKKIQTKIDLRMNEFPLDDYFELDKKTVAKLRRDHEKKFQIPHLREQVKTLKFLLKN